MATNIRSSGRKLKPKPVGAFAGGGILDTLGQGAQMLGGPMVPGSILNRTAGGPLSPGGGAFGPGGLFGGLPGAFGLLAGGNRQGQGGDDRGEAQLTPEEQKALVDSDADRKAKKERQNKYFSAAANLMGIDWLPYATGGLVAGPGDGRSDSVAGQAPGGPIKVSDGEFIVPADVVSALGNGSTKAGAAHLAKLIQDTRASWGKQVGAFKRPRKG
jgi:hypothetical protein